MQRTKIKTHHLSHSAPSDFKEWMFSNAFLLAIHYSDELCMWTGSYLGIIQLFHWLRLSKSMVLTKGISWNICLFNGNCSISGLGTVTMIQLAILLIFQLSTDFVAVIDFFCMGLGRLQSKETNHFRVPIWHRMGFKLISTQSQKDAVFFRIGSIDFYSKTEVLKVPYEVNTTRGMSQEYLYRILKSLASQCILRTSPCVAGQGNRALSWCSDLGQHLPLPQDLSQQAGRRGGEREEKAGGRVLRMFPYTQPCRQPFLSPVTAQGQGWASAHPELISTNQGYHATLWGTSGMLGDCKWTWVTTGSGI